ncbi:MAG: MFS transporter [Lentisphaeria bacterium]|nr:MFS transporter [Lentisphaeria bacterium]
MIKAVSYIIPVMMNFVFGAILFITVQRFTDAGASKLITGLPLTAWALIYGILNPIIGKCANDKNSARFIVASGFLTVISAAGFLFIPTLFAQFIWMSLLGVAFALYCVPFQIFAKSMESGDAPGANAICKTSGRYTAAWSAGLACGPLVFGFLNATTGFIICMVIGLMMSFTIWMASRKLSKAPVIAETGNGTEHKQEKEVSGLTLIDFAWVGWIVGGIGTFGVNQLRTQLQPLGVECGFDGRALAIMLFSISIVQSMTGLALSFTGTKWQFKKLPALLIGLIGVITLAIFGIREFAPGFYGTAAIYGIYSGCFYFYFVYYSLSHPTKSGVYAGVNELVVSLNSIIAPVIGGVLATMNQVYPFRVACGLVIFATILHVVMLSKVTAKK